MTDAVGGAFVSKFPATGVLGLSLTSIAGSAGANGNATAILAATSTNPSSPFTLLGATSATNTTSPTIRALTTGQLSNLDHKVIAQIGQTANNSLFVPFNNDGSVPSEIAKLRDLRWIRLDNLQVAPGARVATGGTFSLTQVGQAIFKRTVSTTLGPSSQAAASNAAAVKSKLAAEVSTLLGALSSVGVNVKV